jgi:hypothetical protein
MSASSTSRVFEMSARRLRHHAAEAPMLGQLAINHIGEDRATASPVGASTMATAARRSSLIPITRMVSSASAADLR